MITFEAQNKDNFTLGLQIRNSTGNFISEVVYPNLNLVDKVADYMAGILMSYPHISWLRKALICLYLILH